MSYLTVKLYAKKQWYLAVFLPLFIFGCSTTTSQKSLSESKSAIVQPTIAVSTKDWTIMDPPLRAERITFVDRNTGEDVYKAWVQLTNKEILNLLSNTRSEISVGKVNASGQVTYLVAQATGEIGTYRVIMDYTPYIVRDMIDESTNRKIGDARVGVGLRLTAKITTRKENINLGSLLALGIAANSGQLQGTMTVDTIGIRIPSNSGLILSNTTIDETSILKTLESLAVIQSKIADDSTHLDPQILWIKPIATNISAGKRTENAQK